MHLVCFVVETQHIHQQVDPKPQRLLALRITTRRAIERPRTQPIALKCAEQIAAK